MNVKRYIAWLLSAFISLPVVAEDTLKIATTTSLESSGVLAYLVKHFEAANAVKVEYVAVGTGQALRLGRSKSVDLVLAHAPELELKFVDEGFGKNRQEIMYSDFLLVGPKHDVAMVASSKDIGQAFQRLAKSGANFISRGDFSATHKLEQKLWRHAGIDHPVGQAWYIESGMGMKKTFEMASRERAYTLIDRGTWLFNQEMTLLKPLYENPSELRTVYSVIIVTEISEKQQAIAERFQTFLASKEGQHLIAEYLVKDYQVYKTLLY